MKISRKQVLALGAVLLALPMMTACESMNGWTGGKAKNAANADDISKPMDITSQRMDAAPGVLDVPQFPVPQDRDLKVMTSKLSGGSVEIYNLDDDSAQMDSASVPPVQPVYAGIPLATDPNVTVYPLDGVGGSYGNQVTSAPLPVQEWPNAVLPMGRMASSGPGSMTAAPGQWKDDARMNIVGGKLAPAVGTDVSSVYFPYGSAGIGSPERSALKNVAETAKFAPVDRVSVEGHASPPTQTDDPIKAKILNLKESMNRAQAVSQSLIEQGVPAEKIKAVGWGDTKPASGNEAAQRRVDIVTGLNAGQ